MTDNWQRFTNKKLFHARVHLEAWKHAEGVSGAAFRDACIHSMVGAYQSLLAEILMVYQIPVKQLPDMTDAWVLLQQKHESSSELAYIKQLEQKPGWLLSLKRAYQASFLPEVNLPKSQSGELALHDLEEKSLSSLDEVSGVLDSLRELVSYSRNYSFEW